MAQEFLPFAKPSISQAAIDEVVACLKSGWITTGPRVQQFEQLLRDYFDAPFALTLTSATAGLELALQALELQPGDEVITSPMTFVATLNTIVLAGGKPVLVDVEPGRLNIDADKIEAAITPRTKVIMPVHFAGCPIEMDKIYALAKKYQLRVVEDVAHSIGAEYAGKRIGTYGDIQVFSFHPNKNMTTGEGGCVVTRDEKVADTISKLRFHGIDRAAWNRFSKEGSAHYDVVVPGYKYNMMDIQAALGIHQLPALEGFIEKRTQLVQRYKELLKNWSCWQMPPDVQQENSKHAWHLFTPFLLLSNELKVTSRDEFIDKMKEHNIGLGYHYRAVHHFSYYQAHYGWRIGDFPHAERASDCVVSLPLFPDLSMTELERVVTTMREVLYK